MNETAPKKRRAWLWLAVLTPLAAVGTVALLLALGVLFKASGETLEPTREERALLLEGEGSGRGGHVHGSGPDNRKRETLASGPWLRNRRGFKREDCGRTPQSHPSTSALTMEPSGSANSPREYVT